MQEIRRTKHSKTYDTGQRVTKEINGEMKEVPILLTRVKLGFHYWNNGWLDFDGTWLFDDGTDPDGNMFGWKVQKADHHTRFFTQNPNKKRLRVGFATGVYVEYGLPSIDPAFSGNTAKITDGWTNSDLIFTTMEEGIKSDIVLKAPGHPTSFSFPISTVGCTPQKEGNMVVFYANGSEVGRIPAPYMVDAKGEVGSVSLTYDGQNIGFWPDGTWLANAAYPVKVDPTTVLITTNVAEVMDADVRQRSTWAGSNFGGSAELYLGNYQGSVDVLAYADLSLFGITAGSTINKATFGFKKATSVEFIVDVSAITASWAESTVTWNNKPTIEATPTTTVDLNVSTKEYTDGVTATYSIMDVTSLFAAWFAGTKPNYGIYIVRNPQPSNAYLTTNSSEATSQRPVWEVEYTEGSSGTLSPVFGPINSLGRRLVS